MARIQTAEKTWIFDLSQPGEANISGTRYLDCGQVHSLVNRVGARQGYEYVIQSLEIGCTGGGSFSASIYRLPEHWPCINAWEKTMRLWLEQQNETADEAGLESTIARYRDFKVHFDTDHITAGFAANLIPSGFSLNDPASTADVYDWEPSVVVIPNDAVVGTTTEITLMMLGDDVGANRAGMIKAYADSRSRPQVEDPNIVDVATGGLFGEMFDVGMDDETIVDNFQETNNQPPYLVYRGTADEAYPGGSFQGIGPIDGGGGTHPGVLMDVLSIGASQNFNSDTMSGFVAPCGLIKIEYNATGVLPGNPPAPGAPPISLWMRVTMAPGEYKGLLAQSMQEAN